MAGKADDYNTDNLVTFRPLWLDSNVNNDENLVAQIPLRTIINHLETFVDPDECRQSIEQTPKDDRVVLIVSGQLGERLVPLIHESQRVSAVYVYCRDENRNKVWADKFKKVIAVMVNLNELVARIQWDQKYRENKGVDSLGINIFSESKNTDRASSKLNGQFVHFQILIDVLLRIKPNEKDKTELIALCKENFKGNQDDLSDLKGFAQEYSPSTAVWWYTKESFIYKMLNKALRMQNIDVLFLLRFLIRDIDRQLRDNQLRRQVTVYRGQLMSSSELERLRNSVGDIISMNSFVSTSEKREKAIGFLTTGLEPSGVPLEKVLFEIVANPQVNTTKSFAYIDKLSFFPGEFEVLFMLGSSFRVNEVCAPKGVEEEWTTVRMSLCGDDKYDLHGLYQHMKTQYGTGETNLLSLGNVLRLMGKYDLAEQYYRRFLHELPSNHPLSGELYHNLGLVAKAKDKLDKSLKLQQKALTLLKQTRPSDFVIIGNVHNAIGEIDGMTDDIKALESFKQAVSLFEQAQNENHLDMALFHDNIGIIYQKQENYLDALASYGKSLLIRQKHLPPTHQDLAKSFHNIGIVRLRLGLNDLAITNFKRALDIRERALPDNHSDIAMSHKNLGDAYENKGVLEKALNCFQKASEIYKEALSPDHADVIGIQKDIERVSVKPK